MQATADPALQVPPRPAPLSEDVRPPVPAITVGLPPAPPHARGAEPALAFERVLGEPWRPANDSRAEDALTTPARPGTPAAVWLAWAGTIILLALLIWCGYAFRAEVMHVWPASQRLYALFGMAAASAPVAH